MRKVSQFTNMVYKLETQSRVDLLYLGAVLTNANGSCTRFLFVALILFLHIVSI